MIEFISDSIKSTSEFAKQIALKVKSGDVILLFGDLGAGKTTFTKCLCKCLGVTNTVTSPTFTIMNQHKGKDFLINHFDMYRLESKDEAIELGFDEILGSKGCICVVEWPERCLSIFPENSIKIYVESLGETKRKFKVEGL